MSLAAPRRIAVYLSGHGYGHLAQTAPLLLALDRLLPGIELILRTDLPPDLLHRTLPGLNLRLLPGPVDVGVVQRSAIEEDWGSTRAAVALFFGAWAQRITKEVTRLAPCTPEIIISNISPLAFPVARCLGITSIALASLDWASIYRPEWGTDDPFVQIIEQAQRDCDLRLSPPLSLPSADFCNTRPIPLLVRPRSVSRQKVRTTLGWNQGERVALVLFGGTGQPSFDLHELAAVEGWRFMLPERLVSGDLPPNVGKIAIDAPFATPDLLGAADAVVTKPGYGVLSEAWQGACPVVYLPRTGFAEYPMLRDWLHDSAPSARLDLAPFRSGDWGQALAQATTTPRRYPPCDPSGGQVAAEIVAGLRPNIG